MARNMDEKQPLLKNENQTQIDIESAGSEKVPEPMIGLALRSSDESTRCL